MQEKLLILRKRRGFSQSYMANILGISTTQYGSKERGTHEFTQDEMFKTREIFGERIEDIFLPRSHQIGDNKKL